jgi:hypothetical protein
MMNMCLAAMLAIAQPSIDVDGEVLTLRADAVSIVSSGSTVENIGSILAHVANIDTTANAATAAINLLTDDLAAFKDTQATMAENASATHAATAAAMSEVILDNSETIRSLGSKQVEGESTVETLSLSVQALVGTVDQMATSLSELADTVAAKNESAALALQLQNMNKLVDRIRHPESVVVCVNSPFHFLAGSTV